MFFLHFETFNFGAFMIIIEDGCLEDGIIIVEDVDAERTRCEEWESLDQSLRLEENPSSLQQEIEDVSKSIKVNISKWGAAKMCYSTKLRFSSKNVNLQNRPI